MTSSEGGTIQVRWRPAALLVALGSGCAGSCTAGGGAPVDAAAPLTEAGPPTEAATPDVVDATACSDACSDGHADAMQDSDASDVSDGPEVADAFDESDVGDESDAPSSSGLVTHNELCHITWPQAAGYSNAGDTFRLVVDPSGNAYAAITYSSSPALDLGIASPGDAVGIAVAKVDPQCHLLWMREFGGPSGASAAAINGKLAVDATSNVTLAGVFNGPVSFGAAAVGGYQVGYVLRLDADGNVVFTHTYPTDFPSLVGVEADGTAALLFYDYGAFECSLNPSFCDGGAPQEAGASFYSLALLDAAGHETARHSFPGFPGVTGFSPATFTDLSLDPSGMIWAIDNGADAGPALERLTQSGVPLWSQPTGRSVDLALGPPGGVIFAPASNGVQEQFALCGFDGGPVWNVDIGQIVSQPLFGDVAVDVSGRVYAAGQMSARALPASGAAWSSNVVGVEIYDPQGPSLALRAWASESNDYYRAFALDPSGNAFLGGDFFDDEGGFSYFVVKLGP